MTNINRNIAPEFQMIQSFDVTKAEKIQLDNGIEVYALNSGTQDIIKLDLILKSGVKYQPKPLVASFTNAMLTEGTKKYSSKEIAEKLDFYGAYFQPITELDNSILSLLSLNKFLDETLEIFSEILKNPTFPKNEFEILLNKRKQNFKLESEKTKVLAKRKFQTLLFGEKHPYSNTFTLKNFDQINITDLIDYHQKVYNSQNCWIVVSGKINKNVIEKINQTFGQNNWNNGEKSIDKSLEIKELSQKTKVEKKDAVQSAIRIGKVLFNKKHPDYLKLQVVNIILGGYFGSRLMSNIREDKGYTYGIGSALVSLKETGYIVIMTEVGSDVTEKAINEIYKEIDRLRTEKIGIKELQRVKNYFLGEMIKNFDGPFALSDTYKSILEYDFNFEYFQKVYDTIVNISTDDVLNLANKYLDPNSMTQVVAGK
jgi:zinc protease